MKRSTKSDKVAMLSRAPLFEGLSKKELALLATVTDEVDLEPGSVLFREGEIGREFHVIIDGEG